MPTFVTADLASTLARPARRALLLWALVTVAAIVEAAIADMRGNLDVVLQTGPASDLHVTMLACALVWYLFGMALAMLASRRLTLDEALLAGGVIVVGLFYANVLRERLAYLDLIDYVQAAANLEAEVPLPPRYLYPPLWATLLQGLMFFGPRAVFDASWLLNVLAVMLFFRLTVALLIRYGFGRRTAIAVSLAFVLIDVPLLRTLVYGQINLHAMNLVLAAFLWYPRRRFWSAVALAAAVHLKISPVLLALPFILALDFVWVAIWIACLGAFALPTLVSSGAGPFLDTWRNVQNIYQANPLSFRETSIDSFVRATAVVLQVPLMIGFTVLLMKGIVAAASLAVAMRDRRAGTFVNRALPGAAAFNMLPALLVLMVVLSPLLWEHHPVFAGLSFLVLAPHLRPGGSWLVFAAAYAVVFLVPTFDFYPFSYGRLAALLTWLVLDWRLGRTLSV
jgi:alpha-1,2-mannosyltransferase